MFYERLKQACKEKNTTITSTIKKLGLSTGNGTVWKKGAVPSSDVVVKLAEYLDVSTDYLLLGKINSSLSDDENEIVADYRLLNENGQKYVQHQLFIAKTVYGKDK